MPGFYHGYIAIFVVLRTGTTVNIFREDILHFYGFESSQEVHEFSRRWIVKTTGLSEYRATSKIKKSSFKDLESSFFEALSTGGHAFSKLLAEPLVKLKFPCKYPIDDLTCGDYP